MKIEKSAKKLQYAPKLTHTNTKSFIFLETSKHQIFHNLIHNKFMIFLFFLQIPNKYKLKINIISNCTRLCESLDFFFV